MSQPQQFPAGWDAARVRGVIAHYDAQTEDEQAAEIEAALAADGVTLMAVPAELAEQVRALVARHKTAEPGAAPDTGPKRPVQVS
jgi:hypothetical protein